MYRTHYSDSCNDSDTDTDSIRVEYYNPDFHNGSDQSSSDISIVMPPLILPQQPPEIFLGPIQEDAPSRHSLQAAPIISSPTLVQMGLDSATNPERWKTMDQPKKEALQGKIEFLIYNCIKPSVFIFLGNHKFNCHMEVLQSYSKFFRDCETNQTIIKLPEERISQRAFACLYDWMLTEDPVVGYEGVVELYSAATFLGMDELASQCWIVLDHVAYEDVACEVYLDAKKYGLKTLKELMMSRFGRFFLTFVSLIEFLETTYDEVVYLLKLNTLAVNSEVEIFFTALRWLCYNWEERGQYMVEIMSCVRFKLMTPFFLATLQRNKCPHIQRIVRHTDLAIWISEGLSYASIFMSYRNHEEHFEDLIERCQLLIPKQREWVYSQEYDFTKRFNCPNTEVITYESFLGYLSMVQALGVKYWGTLKQLQPYATREHLYKKK